MLARSQLPQNAVAVFAYFHWNLVRTLGRRRTRTLGISEHVQVSERQTFDKCPALFELRARLTRKAGHYVGADRCIRHPRASLADAVLIMPRPVLAVHAAQHAIGTRLQRRVNVLGDPWRRRQHL